MLPIVHSLPGVDGKRDAYNNYDAVVSATNFPTLVPNAGGAF